MKSITMIELRTMMPASAIMPIIAVAVNQTVGMAADRPPGDEVQDPEAGSDADRAERDRELVEERQASSWREAGSSPFSHIFRWRSCTRRAALRDASGTIAARAEPHP
jgi:hypothetical protein